MEIIITDHAFDRRKRLGIKKSAFSRIAEKAYEDGLRHSDAPSRLHKYITAQYFKTKAGNNIRIFHEFVWVFSNNILITVFGLPNNLKKLAR